MSNVDVEGGAICVIIPVILSVRNPKLVGVIGGRLAESLIFFIVLNRYINFSFLGILLTALPATFLIFTT